MRTHSSILKKSRKSRTHKKFKKRSVIGVAVLVVCILLVIFFAWLSTQERFLIKSVNIEGNNIVNRGEVLSTVQKNISGKYYFLFSKNNILLYPKSEIKDILFKKFKRIKSIDIKRKKTNNLNVYINEYLPKYLLCSKEPLVNTEDIKSNCYYLDKEGYIYAKAPSFSDNVFFKWNVKNINEINIGEFVLNKNEFNKLVTLKQIIDGIGLSPTGINGMDDGDFAFMLDGGGKILFNIKQDSTRLVDTLDSVLGDIKKDKKFEYIDLRFGDKVFYK